jgi:cold shock CspA family protein
MGRAQETFKKKDLQNRKDKKKKEKEQKRLERKANTRDGNNLDDMIAYVDENGQITSTPPDLTKKKTDVKLEDIVISVPKREDIEEDPLHKGTVAFFNDSKGYGFIRDAETQQSVFVHVNGLTEPIVEGNKVVFEVEMGAKGPCAVNVKVVRA